MELTTEKTALLIVDMQHEFYTARHKGTIKTCITEIRRAIKAELPIIVLEYDGCGETLPELKKHLDKYKRTKYVEKCEDGGGHEVMNALQDEKWVIENFIVCGVNINACVARTIAQLVTRYIRKAFVVKRACNGSEPNRRVAFHGEKRHNIYKNKNVKFI
jgi:nicotinamidase-related amidase